MNVIEFPRPRLPLPIVEWLDVEGITITAPEGRAMNPEFLRNNCDGSGPHSGLDVRVYPLGSGNLILCKSCWRRENAYRYRRGLETGAPENWPQLDWIAAELYDAGP